jgi:hypothetical protein
MPSTGFELEITNDGQTVRITAGVDALRQLSLSSLNAIDSGAEVITSNGPEIREVVIKRED